MTRKDYVLIAAALKTARDMRPTQVVPDFNSWRVAMDYAAGQVAIALSRDNPRFDRERFLKAAGVQS